jgi:hypothetical protein
MTNPWLAFPCQRCGKPANGPGFCTECHRIVVEEEAAERNRKWEGWRAGQMGAGAAKDPAEMPKAVAERLNRGEVEQN